MGCRAQGWLDRRSGRWYARLGDEDLTTGRRRAVIPRDETGEPIAPRDRKGAATAVARLVAQGKRLLDFPTNGERRDKGVSST